MKLFFSFKFDCPELEHGFIKKLREEILKLKDPEIPPFDVYYNLKDRKAGKFRDHLKREIESSGTLLFFLGNEIGDIQKEELKYAHQNNINILPLNLPSYKPLQALENSIQPIIDKYTYYEIEDIEQDDSPNLVAKRICKLLRFKYDGLPLGYPFSYEKEIIAAYLENGELKKQKIIQGCPEKWPSVSRKIADHRNPIPEEIIGGYRDIIVKEVDEKNPPGYDPRVLPAALVDYHKFCLKENNISFPEAGPRLWLSFNKKQRINVGILVSGGIAPGVNAVLAGLMKRQILYADHGKWNCQLTLYREGFKSLTSHNGSDRVFREYKTNVQLKRAQMDFELNQIYANSDSGGSFLPTARADELLPNDYEQRHEKLKLAIDTLKNDHINVLYVVGGDGSMKAAHAIQTMANRTYKELTVVGIPKTMDNDVLWVWQSFGFPSAVEWAKNAIRQLYTEAKSNPRLCVVQLFGSDSGFVVSHAALASGVCDYALIPEIEFDLEKTCEHMISVLRERRRNEESPYGVILMAETALPKNPEQYLDIAELKLNEKEKEAVRKYEASNRRVYGQTPDDVRSAALKIISGYMRKKIHSLNDYYWKQYRVFTNEPRHLIRSVQPSVADIIFGERLGSLAVDGAMAGYNDFMISQWLTEFILVPLELVVLGRKRIPTNGIFWRSVVAKTGQDS